MSNINPLLEHKRAKQEEAIRTLESNKTLLDLIIRRLHTGAYPSVISFTYVPGSYCLTVKYVAMSVQWYVHKDLCYVQEGNAKKRSFTCNGAVFVLKLEQGRRAFQ